MSCVCDVCVGRQAVEDEMLIFRWNIVESCRFHVSWQMTEKQEKKKEKEERQKLSDVILKNTLYLLTYLFSFVTMKPSGFW